VHQGDLVQRPLGVGVNTPAIRHYLEGLAASPFTSGTLSQAVEINPRMDLRELPDDFPVSFLPMEAVEDRGAGGFRLQTRPLVEVSKGYTPFGEGDIVWAKIAPCMQNGKSTVVTGLENGLGFGSTEFHVLRPRSKQVLAEYVWYFLSFGKILEVAQAAFTGSAGQQRVPVEFLRDLPFPLPPQPMQQELVAAMNAARALRQQQLAEAEALLGSFDDYLLTTLGISAPANDGRRVFGVRMSDAFQKGRINPEYFHPERLLTLRAIEEAGVQHERLGSIVDFVRQQIKTPGENYLSLGHVQSQTGELVASSETSEGSCFTFLAGDVLFMRLRPYLNKVYLAEADGCCSPEFHVLRVRDEAIIHADYLAVALRSRLMLLQTVHMMTGNTHPRLANEDVPDLILPVPSLAVQREIVAEVQRRRTQARQLREAAETGWAAAKARFEQAIIN
jgi:type I restriction enzyme S subunit